MRPARWPCYLATSRERGGFAPTPSHPPGLSALTLGLLCLVGGSTGAVLLLLTPDATFRRVVPWLLLLATFLFIAGPRLAPREKTEAARPMPAMLGVLAVTAYGGYFNGGLGILLLALFGLLGQKNLHAMNGLKNQVSALLTLIAVSLYAWGGLIAWREALVMMGAALLGGYMGARVAKRIPIVWLRRAIAMVGLTMSMLFFIR